MDLTTASPVEIDTALAEIWERWHDKGVEIDRQQRYLDDYEQTLAQVDAGTYKYHWSDKYDRPRTQKAIAELADKVDALREQAREIIKETRPLDAEYRRRGGWTRFYQVRDGHIHSSMDCSTCNHLGKATKFGWLPQWSGQSEEQALEALVTESHKTVLCTVCYPSAPVAWTVARPAADQCPGSATFDYPRETARQGYYTGNYGVCSHCDQVVTTTSTGKMRKHKI